MRQRDPNDPLLLQILPTAAETVVYAGFTSDPLAEQGLARHGGILKYPGRALLITTAACPVHCRYCFRREFPYAEQTAVGPEFPAALAAIRAATDIREIILSGGDPLSLSNSRLARLIGAIEALPNVRTLRIHTRFPIVLPSRVDPGLLDLLQQTRLNTVIVVHANHPAEIDESVIAAAAKLKGCTDLLLNQSVLLHGINDNVATLIRLSERLLECGITPYYLHLLDRVSGTQHFDIEVNAAAQLIDDMRSRAPGYLIPRLVRDQAGELSKTPIQLCSVPGTTHASKL
jgi:EF-P beta-lysylation protein EpmB